MRQAVLAVVAVFFMVLVACTSTEGGTPTPATAMNGISTSKATGPTSASAHEAPAITEPELDLDKIATPCDLLTADQLAARGVIKPGKQVDDEVGPSCEWFASDQGRGTNFEVAFLSKSNGLEGVYAGRDLFPVFQPTEIAGYPAVNTDLTDAKHGECSTAVGVAEGKGFLVQVNVNDIDGPEYTKPCSVSSAIATTVLENLKR